MYLLLFVYDNGGEYNTTIVTAGNRARIVSYLRSQYENNRKVIDNIKTLFSKRCLEINALDMLVLETCKMCKYCTLLDGPGYGIQINRFNKRDEAINDYNNIVDKYKDNTDDEWNNVIKLYKFTKANDGTIIANDEKSVELPYM